MWIIELAPVFLAIILAVTIIGIAFEWTFCPRRKVYRSIALFRKAQDGAREKH
jgi:predicted membrane channel-forming protein YqfA (hemolysin III family)